VSEPAHSVVPLIRCDLGKKSEFHDGEIDPIAQPLTMGREMGYVESHR
jgi:hypothetical protein